MDDEKFFNPLNLNEKKILVTGASSGIGREVAGYLAALGAKIVLSGRNQKSLGEVLKNLPGKGHVVIDIDLAETKDLSCFFDRILEDQVKLDGLVNSAGIPYVMPLSNLTYKRMLESFDINFFAFIELVRQFSKKKYSNGGSIVGISSVASERAAKCQTAYSSAKAAVDNAIQALAIELAGKKIRINSVVPGAIATRVIEENQHNGIIIDFNKEQLLGVGQPRDVAAACAFLISDMSSFITGRRLFVDGGRFF